MRRRRLLGRGFAPMVTANVLSSVLEATFNGVPLTMTALAGVARSPLTFPRHGLGRGPLRAILQVETTPLLATNVVKAAVTRSTSGCRVEFAMTLTSTLSRPTVASSLAMLLTSRGLGSAVKT